jgi:hypothetical protein
MINCPFGHFQFFISLLLLLRIYHACYLLLSSLYPIPSTISLLYAVAVVIIIITHCNSLNKCVPININYYFPSACMIYFPPHTCAFFTQLTVRISLVRVWILRGNEFVIFHAADECLLWLFLAAAVAFISFKFLIHQSQWKIFIFRNFSENMILYEVAVSKNGIWAAYFCVCFLDSA